MLKTPSKFLATIQIGITLAGFLSSAFASDAFANQLAPVLNNLIPVISLDAWRTISIILITIVLSFFTLVFGELVPKRLAMKNYEKISFATIGVIRAISIVTAPFVKLLTSVTNAISKLFGVNEQDEETVTEEEIKMMVDQGKENGTIDEEEKELINNVFEFNDITVSEIMTHRTDIFAVDMNIGMDELLHEIEKSDYKISRIPVFDETIDDIKGILYLKDVLKNIHKKTFKVKNIMKDAYFVPQNKLINELFKELQKNKTQMAIILDEYGGTAGLITMEDILEELVGDIYDEYDDIEEEFEKAMDDDFNTPNALSVLFEMAREINKLQTEDAAKANGLAARLRELAGILGLLQQDPEKFLQAGSDDDEVAKIEALIKQRNEARAAKDWTAADAARNELTAMGIVLEDGANGTTWRKQ